MNLKFCPRLKRKIFSVFLDGKLSCAGGTAIHPAAGDLAAPIWPLEATGKVGSTFAIKSFWEHH